MSKRARLLDRRWPYIGLGLLVVLLYLRAAASGVAPEWALESAAPPESDATWWQDASEADLLQELVTRRQPAALALGLLMMVMVGLGLGGLVVTCRAAVTGRLRAAWQLTGPRPPAWTFGELGRILFFVLAVALLLPFVRIALLASQPTWQLDTNLWLTASMLLLDVFVILVIAAFALRTDPHGWSRLGVSTRNLGATVNTALVSYVGVFPWLFVLLVLAVEASRHLGLEPPVEPIHRLLFAEDRAPVLWLTALLACVVGPVAEELFFRGVFYAALRQRNARVVSMLISGSLFSLIHTNHVGFLPILALGCLLAYLYERTRSLLAPMAVHIVHNTLLLSLAVIFRTLGPVG